MGKKTRALVTSAHVNRAPQSYIVFVFPLGTFLKMKDTARIFGPYFGPQATTGTDIRWVFSSILYYFNNSTNVAG